jgi:hypothetical protein
VNSGTALSASSAQTFNQQASALQKRLNSQSGGSIQLVIANAIWTRNLAVRKSYADEMKAQYNVSGVAEAVLVMQWVSAVCALPCNQAAAAVVWVLTVAAYNPN